MSARTFGRDHPASVEEFRMGTGLPNSYPKVGPVVISEIMYHPPDIIVSGLSTIDNVVEEFIELYNPSPAPAPLYDPGTPTNTWRLRDAVDYDFPLNASIAPGGYILVVSFDPATNLAAKAQFQARYGSNSILYGPYGGKLDNSSERVELYKPDPPNTNGVIPYVLVEKVEYEDRGSWPTNADGFGFSLQRVSVTGYANDPTNWIAAAPTPGPSGFMDSDDDGMPDAWEMQFGLNKNDPSDAAQDPDQDGLTNLQEYLAGTDPHDGQSNLRVVCPGLSNGQAIIQFSAVAGRTYTVLYRSAAHNGTWQKFADVAAQPVTQTVTLYDPSATTNSQRYYRLVTPAAP
jgi:hypothetical protein